MWRKRPVADGGALYGSWRRLCHAALATLLAVLAPTPAAAAEKLVLALGDSLTAGYGLAPGQSFPAKLEAALRRGGMAVRVANAGVSGDTSAQGRARLSWVLRGLGRNPDLAIVELGANDMLRGLSPGIAEANLDAILAELARRKVPVILAGMRSAPNMGRAYVARFEGIYPALAAKYRARLYPFFLDGVAGNRALTQPDGLHPTAQGVDIITKGMLPMVREALR